MARVLVTGGSGFVGRSLIEALLGQGHQVWCVSRSRPIVDSLSESLEWIQSDLGNGRAYADAIARADCIFHLASLLTARRRSEYVSVNVEGTRALFDTCYRAGQHIRRFVYMSSIAAMGPTDDGCLLTESTPCRPRTQYGASKLAAEHIVRENASEFPAVILRPSFIYGPGDVRGAVFLRELLGTRWSPSRLTIRTISFCHVSDVVRACLRALESESPGGQMYLVAEPKSYEWSDVDEILERALSELAASCESSEAELARHLLERVRAVTSEKANEIDGEHWGCDTRRAARELGFAAQRSLDEAAGEVIESYLRNGLLMTSENAGAGTEA
jgi:nucleoside-diphosphate-sugar epimerase